MTDKINCAELYIAMVYETQAKKRPASPSESDEASVKRSRPTTDVSDDSEVEHIGPSSATQEGDDLGGYGDGDEGI